ncbi:MAG: hypothetical protein NZZ41_07840, partial [Candidatus Dojkabacteria bacterium]|nr:hypothetical protein [Candidatus Dojkabacteria bacterium]
MDDIVVLNPSVAQILNKQLIDFIEENPIYDKNKSIAFKIERLKKQKWQNNEKQIQTLQQLQEKLYNYIHWQDEQGNMYIRPGYISY